MARRTSDANGRQGRGGRSPAPGKPRTLDHFCKPCSLIAKGDTRDCPACMLDALELTRSGARRKHPTITRAKQLAIADVKAKARGTRNVRGTGVRNMANIDIHGRRWGYEPSKPVHISGWRPKK